MSGLDADAEEGAALYRAAIAALSLHAQPDDTIDKICAAASAVKGLAGGNVLGGDDELTRLQTFCIAGASASLLSDTIRPSLAADLADRNRRSKEQLQSILDRIDDTYYYARGHGAVAELAALHRELIEKVELSYGFPDLDVSDWLNTFGGLLLNLDEIEEGERRIEQSLHIEKLLSGEESVRVAERLEWRGSHFARRGWSDRAKADLERALEILVALPTARRPQIENIVCKLKDIAPVSRVFSDLVRAYELWRGFILREHGGAHDETAEASYRLSRAYEDAGLVEQAVTLAKAACDEHRAAVGPAGAPSRRYLEHLAKLSIASVTTHEIQ